MVYYNQKEGKPPRLKEIDSMTKREQYMQELEVMMRRLREMADSKTMVTDDEEAEDMGDRLCEVADDIEWIVTYLNI